jgi:ketosteroid isomerase-like protein
MSQDNVDLVRRQIGDADLAAILRDDEAWATWLAEIGPSFVEDFKFVVHVPGEPVVGNGFREYRERFVDWIEPLETYFPHIEEVFDLGDRVLVLGRDSGRMRGSDREIESPKGGVLYSFERGKVSKVEYFFNRAEALEAAGLRE